MSDSSSIPPEQKTIDVKAQEAAQQSIEEQASLSLANKDLNHIRILQESEAYKKYYLRRLHQKKATIAEKIFDANTKNEDVPALRAVHAAYTDLEQMLDEDAIGCRNILNLDAADTPLH